MGMATDESKGFPLFESLPKGIPVIFVQVQRLQGMTATAGECWFVTIDHDLLGCIRDS
jgi:hypothetical protein